MVHTSHQVLLLLFIFINKDVFCKSHGSFFNRIAGGDPIPITRAPYQVWLLNGGFGCGGSILNPRTILTAAHCIHEELTTIRIGSANKGSGGSVYQSNTAIKHPQYTINLKSVEYDVAIVKLDQDMALDGVNAKCVSLAESGTQTPPGTDLFITGWGRVQEGGPASPVLMGVNIPVVSNQECAEPDLPITDRMLCAGLKEGGKDSCKGDSGGPAVVSATGVQVGIVSFGKPCASPNAPGVYARVADPSIREFIRQHSGTFTKEIVP